MFLSDETIKRKVASGMVILGVKRVLIQLILTGSNILLARMLAPEIFGAFGIISFLILSLGILTNFGLCSALIQKKEKVAKKELRAIFTALLLGSLALVFLIYFFAPLTDVLYQGKLGKSGIFWLRLFSLNLLLTNLTAISISLLERKLDYKKLAFGSLTILFLTNFLVIIFALKGLGVGSFVLGNLLGGVANLALFYYLSPWPIGFNFSLADLKSYLPFGLNFQANQIIGITNGAIIPGFVGAVVGSKAVGLVNWAGGVRAVGLAPAEIIGGLIFPAGSRIQDNKKFLESLTEKMLQLSSMLTLPLLAAIFALARPITEIIYTSKWLPGLTALYLSLIQGIFILLGVILVDVLFALGQAKTVRNISLFWAILQWVLTVPLVLLWNFNGVVLAGILVSATFFIPLREVRKKMEINLWPHVWPYLVYSILAGLVIFGLSRLIVINSLMELLAVGLAGGIFYWGMVFVFKKKEVIKDLMRLQELVVEKKEKP